MLEKALAVDPNFAEARAWYGFTHVLQIDSGASNDTRWLYSAEEQLRRALRDDPNLGRAHSSLAAVHLNQGRKEMARAEAQKALEINPQDVDGYIWLANCYKLDGNYPAAQALLKKLLDRDPLFFPARMNLGDLLLEQGDTAGAIRELEKILEQDPTNVYALDDIARAYMVAGDFPRARKALEGLRPADRGSYGNRLRWALLLASEGKTDAARGEMNADLLKYGEFAIYTAAVAEFYALLNEVSTALDWLERAVRGGDERVEWFRRDPLLANIRSHPRFKQIVDSVEWRRRQGRAAGQ